jgi:poly(3-hydroxybutyrate) depolymerase
MFFWVYRVSRLAGIMDKFACSVLGIWVCSCEPNWPPDLKEPTDGWVRINIDSSFYEVLAPEIGKTPIPLVVALHGDEGNSDSVKTYWDPVWREHHDFVVVLPQNPLELGDLNEGWAAWPDAGARFLWDVLDDVTARYNVDMSRVYLTGVSAGAVFIGQRGSSPPRAAVIAVVTWMRMRGMHTIGLSGTRDVVLLATRAISATRSTTVYRAGNSSVQRVFVKHSQYRA